MATFFVLAANMLPLAGVWFWGWDAFLVLMVYWAETVIVAGWTLARIATMPGSAGETGRGRHIINAAKTAFFAVHAGAFISAHLFFLLILFSGEWRQHMDGAPTFLRALFIETGAWVALVFAFLAGLVGFVTAIPRPTVVTWVLCRTGRQNAIPASEPLDPDTDHLGPVITALYTRIVVMQVGIIFGAWVAEIFGSRGPLMIVIVLKSIIEMRIWEPWAQTAPASANGKASRAAGP